MNMRSLVAVSVVGLAGSIASGQVILSNLPGTSSGTGTNLGIGTDAADRTKAVGLTMGDTALDFLELDALMSNPDNEPRALSGGIYSDDGGMPGTELAAFDPVDVPAGADAEITTIGLAGNFTLQPSTSYWFVLDGPDFTNSLMWNSLSPNVAPTPSGDVSFDGYSFSSNGGDTWGSSGIFNGVEIRAIPTPGSLALLCGAGLLAGRRRR